MSENTVPREAPAHPEGPAADTAALAEAVRQLVAEVGTVGRVSGREPWRELALWVTRGRWGRRTGWPVVPTLTTPWQDTVSAERHGWRTRAANLHGDFAFAVDYRVCRRCRIGWVEQPYTHPQYQRHGLASAGLATLRAEHPGLAWHTLGGHFRSSQPFWEAVGADVSGSYQQRGTCPHLTRGR
ncbi:hypothetical protein [Micromonospora inaquosa]|uniref:hypothetical protein n=1 Tax=Micromonospora inaquosa TaxID=2203716 RepID=UPI001FCA3C7C|nr:hypothetical protein [Micromonospora inaquosa]